MASLDRAQDLAAVAHLLTPTSCVLGRQVRVAGNVISFRGEKVHVGACSLEEAALRVAALADRVSTGADVFLDVTGGPGGWVKPIRRGAHVLLAGARELFGAPLVRVAVEVWSPEVVRELAHLAAQGSLDMDGLDLGALPWPRDDLHLRGDGAMVTLASAAAAAEQFRIGDPVAEAELLVEAARAMSIVAARAEATDASWDLLEAPFPGTVAVLGRPARREGSQVQVQAVVGAGSVVFAAAGSGQHRCGESASSGRCVGGKVQFRDGAPVAEAQEAGWCAVCAEPRDGWSALPHEEEK